MEDPVQILTEKMYHKKKYGPHKKLRPSREGEQSLMWYRNTKSIKQIRQMYDADSSDSSDFKSDSSMQDFNYDSIDFENLTEKLSKKENYFLDNQEDEVDSEDADLKEIPKF